MANSDPLRNLSAQMEEAYRQAVLAVSAGSPLDLVCTVEEGVTPYAEFKSFTENWTVGVVVTIGSHIKKLATMASDLAAATDASDAAAAASLPEGDL